MRLSAAVLCVLLGSLTAYSARAQTKSLLGKTVVLASPDAKLRGRSGIVVPHTLHRVYLVTGQDGESVFVQDFSWFASVPWVRKEEGWLGIDEVVASEQASDYLSGLKGDLSGWAICTRGMLRHTTREFDKATADYSIAADLGHEPAFVMRAKLLNYEKRDSAGAVKDLTRALELNRRDEFALYERGRIRLSLGEYDQGTDDLNQVLRSNSWNRHAFRIRGLGFYLRTDYAKAIADFQRSSELDPEHASHHLTWLLATCPDAKFRDGKRALESARRANERAEQPSLVWRETLAAAWAEVGDFEQAIQAQSNAVAFLEKVARGPLDRLARTNPRLKQRITDWLARARERLELYRAHKPCREARPDHPNELE